MNKKELKEKFVAIFQAIHKVDKESAEQMYEVEIFNFHKRITGDNYLNSCTDLSKRGTFLEVISNGLSFDSSANHIYLMPRNVKQGSNWVKTLTYDYASDGLIALTKAAGSTQSCSTPVIVFKGDTIQVENTNGVLHISHSIAIPRASKEILGGYMTITLPNGTTKSFWFDISEIERLKAFSAKSNKGKENALYSSDDGQIDLGFLRTKIVKAALKNYPKRKTMMDYYNKEMPSFEEPIEQKFEDAPEPTPVDNESTPAVNELANQEMSF